MSLSFYKGRRWLAAVSFTTALALAGFLGFQLDRVSGAAVSPTVKVSTRSEAAQARG